MSLLSLLSQFVFFFFLSFLRNLYFDLRPVIFLALTEYGGLGLDYTYSVAVAEELGNINCGAIAMAIGVQVDMATPALAR